MSPLEIWSFQFKRLFFLPSFISTSINKDKQFDGNVKFVIDLSEYNQFSTLIQKPQSIYFESEEECLISCYNVYEFINYVYNAAEKSIVVYLKVKNYDALFNQNNRSINGTTHGNIPSAFLKSPSAIKERNLGVAEFNELYEQLLKEELILTQTKK